MTIWDFHVRIVVEAATPYYYREAQTDQLDDTIVDPSSPSTPVRDFTVERRNENTPTCVGNSPVDLDIRTNVGSAIVNDDYTVVKDLVFTKYVKMVVVRDDTSGLLEILAFEKTTGEYGDMPAGKTHVKDLKEFSVGISDTQLTELQSWI